MYQLGLPDDAGSALLIEVDGVIDGLDSLMSDIEAIALKNRAVEVRPARTAAEQTQVWAARKNAFGAMGRLALTTFLVDTVAAQQVAGGHPGSGARSAAYRLPIANVFHAGDGNLHPLVLFDRRIAGQERARPRSVHRSGSSGASTRVAPSGEHRYLRIEKQDFMTII